MRGIKKIVAVALALCCVVGCMGCKKDWWEDWSKIDVVFSAENGTPDTFTVNLADKNKNIHFTYQYDGEEHIPQAKIMVEGEEQGYILVWGKDYFMEDSGRYNPIHNVIRAGKYLIKYYLFKEYKPYESDISIQKDPINILYVNVEIKK